MLASMKHANYFWVFLSIIAAFISYVVRALRWNLLIEPLGYKPNAKNTYYAVMIGYLANIAFPRIGEIVRCSSLNKSEKVPVNKLFGTVLIERASDMVVLLSLLFFIFIIKINVFGAFLTENILTPFYQSFKSLFTVSATSIILLSSFLILIISLFLFKDKIGKIRFIRKFKLFIYGVVSGLKTIMKMKKRKAYLFYTAVIWLMYFLMTYLVFFSFAETSVLKPIDGLFIMIVGGIGMSLPVQGGIGAYHWFTSLGLTLYGIPKDIGIVYATVVHESQALFVILTGGISLIMVVLLRKKKNRSK